MKTSGTIFKPVAILLIIFIAIASLMYWLWQRQPKVNNYQVSNQVQTLEQNKEQESTEFEINPKDESIIKEESTKFSGKTNPNGYVVVVANSNQGITKSNESGQFEIEIQLSSGLNLVNVFTLSENLDQTQNKLITLYVDEKETSNTVYAGPVKGIFDEVITITSSQGEQTIRKKTSTKINFEDSANEKGDDIRVGDFLIVLANKENQKDIDATLIKVHRLEKPQNNKKYFAGILLSIAKENIFSASSINDSKIIEFSLSKNSLISQNGQQIKEDKIAKDKKAIVVYSNVEDKNIPDLVYLLPAS